MTNLHALVTADPATLNLLRASMKVHGWSSQRKRRERPVVRREMTTQTIMISQFDGRVVQLPCEVRKRKPKQD